jgi:hypothetical protein
MCSESALADSDDRLSTLNIVRNEVTTAMAIAGACVIGGWLDRDPDYRELPFILYSRPAEDWLQRSGSSSTISPTTLFFAIAARGRRNCSRSSTRRGSRE